eukprot:gene4734-biopygen4670
MPSGKSICVETLEMAYTAMALVKLHPDYALLKAKFMTESLPAPAELADQIVSHHDTIIAPRSAAIQTAHAVVSGIAGAIADDRRKQAELKRRKLADKVPCPVCHRPGHSAADCFMTNEDKREKFFKKASPKVKEAILKRVEEYKKHGKLPVPGGHLDAVTEESDPHPGLEDSGEALFALRETGLADLHPGLGDTVAADDTVVVLPPVSCETDTRVPVGASALGRPSRARHCYVPSKHTSLLNRHNPVKVKPAYEYWVYVDTITAFFPDKERLERTQSLWGAERAQHLGSGYPISPRQLWFKSGIQRWHTVMMAGSVAILHCAKGMLDTSPPWGIERGAYAEYVGNKVRVVRGIVEHMDKLLQLEPVVVRTSFENLQDWASGLGQTTRALVRAVDLYGALVLGATGGWGAEDMPFSSCSDSESDESLPDLESASDSGSDDVSIPDLESGSDSDDDYCSLPYDEWGCCRCPGDRDDSGSMPAVLSSDYDSGSGGSLPCSLPYDGRTSGTTNVGVACGARSGDALPHSTGGKSAVLDSGATRHIFNSVAVFNEDYDTIAHETFKVVLSDVVTSSGSGSVTFAKTDVRSGRLIGLRLLGAHCIPGQSFNLLSVVALEDAGFMVDFGARTVSKGGAVFCFARIGNQYIIHEDHAGTLDTYLACALQHNDTYLTVLDSCFLGDWAGKHCYGNPPFDHDIILKCLQKALSDFGRDPVNTKFMFVLPKWVTASWWHLATHFSVIHEYPPGAKIFSAPRDSCYNLDNLEPCGEDRVWIEDTKWAVVVLFKDSQTVEQADLKMLQHIGLGYIGDKPVDHMFAQSIHMPITESQYSQSNVLHCSERCIACRLTKAIRPSVKPTGRKLSEEMGTLVWSDTCGPFRASAGGYRWFALFVDDCTSCVCIYFLKHKSDYLDVFKLYVMEVKRLRSTMGLPEKYHMTLHTDGDSTMIAGQTAAYCKQHGIQQRHGSPYLHENQARVERSHRDVQAMARDLLLTSGLGVEMWPLAAWRAVYILNRILKKSLSWDSTYHIIHKRHADLSQLRVFGCLAYAFIDPSLREHKLSDRARELRYVGHSEVSSAYLLYDLKSEKVVQSGMVTFSERLDKLGKVVTTWDPSVLAPLKTNFMVTSLDAPCVDPPPALLEAAVQDLSSYLEPGEHRLSLLRACPTYGGINAHYLLFAEVQAVTGKGDFEEATICARAVTPHAQHYCVVLLTNFTILDLPAGKVQFPSSHTCFGATPGTANGASTSMLPKGVTEPKGHHQVLLAPDCAEWLDSIQSELEALVQVKGALLMMDEEDIPPGVRLLDMSLVLKVKLDKHGELLKRKSRICVRDNKQEYGVDYLDTFAPCTQLSSVSIVIVWALNLGLVVYHMDVDTAFLNSTLEEDLYVRLPRGLEYGGHRCAKLLKAVYGLKQAGKEWFETSDAFIMSYDSRMQKSDVEPCLYLIKDKDLMVIILAFVNDYLVATDSKSWYDDFVAAFHSKYACKDLDILDLVMGIGVRWGVGTAYLSERAYIMQMVGTYGLSEAKPAPLPMLSADHINATHAQRARCSRRVHFVIGNSIENGGA